MNEENDNLQNFKRPIFRLEIFIFKNQSKLAIYQYLNKTKQETAFVPKKNKKKCFCEKFNEQENVTKCGIILPMQEK